MTDHASEPVPTADKVVETEVKVAQQRVTSRGEGLDAPCRCDCPSNAKNLPSQAEKLAEELYKNLSMGCNAYLDMLPHVEDNRIKTDITAAMCYYEKLMGKVKQILSESGATPAEGGSMARMASRAGMAMNTALDKSNSHIAEMLMEGATMSITTAQKLANHAEGKEGCHTLVEYCRDWAKFEQNHVDALKKYL